ncbi:MAG: hypothetical protein CVV27_00140, partial [Candidatus Melainabacteria bacterium HGW-Melainabacteria-1]
MPIAHLAPYYSRHPFDFQDLEYPTRTWLSAVLAELPEVWRASSEPEVSQSLNVLKVLYQAGLLQNQKAWLEQLHSVTQRSGWQAESWLPLYLDLLDLVKAPVSMQLRLTLAEHPQPEIRRWAYARSAPRIPVKLIVLGVPFQSEDEVPLMTRGLRDTDPQVQMLALKSFVDYPLEPTPAAVLEQFVQLSQHPDASLRGQALLALTMARQPELEPLLDQHFEQNPEPKDKALALNAWCCHQLLWPDSGIRPEWHDRLRWALNSDCSDLQAIGIQAVGALGLTDYEAALEPLFSSSEIR